MTHETERTVSNFRQLIAAIVEAFPNPRDFNDNVFYALEEGLDEIVPTNGANYNNQVLAAIREIKARGKLEEFIQSLCDESQNPNLCDIGESIIQELRSQHSDGRRSSLADYERLETHFFDLGSIVDKCISELNKRKGLIGLIIPAKAEPVLDNLLRRLEADYWDRGTLMRRNQLTVRQPLGSVQDFVGVVKSYWGSWLTSCRITSIDIIFYVTVSDEDEAIEFWRGIHAEFGAVDTGNNRFVVVIVSDANPAELPSIIDLPEPVLQSVDVTNWVTDAVNRFDWPRNFIPVWREYILRKCHTGSPRDFFYVYNHIGSVLEKLRTQTPIGHAGLHQLLLEERI